MLIGASGSGKSTLLRCVNLLEDDRRRRRPARRRGRSPTRRCDPDAVRRRARHRLPGVQPVPAPDRAGQRDARAGRRARACRARQADERGARRCSPASGSATGPSEYPDRLSGGQQQRVAIVRALATHRACCCSTRSRARSTPSWSARCSSSSRELKARRHDDAVATHEMGFAREVADEVCFLHEGADRRARARRADVRRPSAAAGPGSSCAGSWRRGGSSPRSAARRTRRGDAAAACRRPRRRRRR